ncbi:MAG: putative quinol monooxygenase [Anaerolineales bacterium]|nr:MAG: putative quinol monooxygenase [Anaerolineales bacterium]
MYAMTGKLIARDGKRAQLAEILKQAAQVVAAIPECQMYIVSEDLSNSTHLWVFEIWDSRDAHDASLGNEQVHALIAQARPLLAAAPDGVELFPIGVHGLNHSIA